MYRTLAVLLLTGCSAPTLDLLARRTASVDGGLEWVTLAIATDAYGNPGRGAVSLQSPSAHIDRSPGSLDADGVASFVTSCLESECSEPIEFSASWNGVTTTRTRMPVAQRWTDTVDFSPGGGLGSRPAAPRTILDCQKTDCLGEAYLGLPGPPPCVESSLGGSASLHLVVRGPAGATDALDVTVSNGTYESCRAGVALNGDTTFSGMVPGAWTVSARSTTHLGTRTIGVSNSSLTTEAVIVVR